MEIRFAVVKTPTKPVKGKPIPREFLVPKDTEKCYIGKYIVRVLTAQEGINALDDLIAETPKFQENPELISAAVFRKKLIEKATLKDEKPIETIDLTTIPNKLWQLLIAAHDKLNAVSNEEAHFLLQPSSSTEKQDIQQ